MEKLDVFYNLGKIHTVDEAKVELTKRGQIENLEALDKITETRELKLKKLAVFFLSHFFTEEDVSSNLHRKFTSLLNKILEQNKNTLESFERFEPIGLYKNSGLKFQFPVLSKLQTLKLHSNEGQRQFFASSRFFPGASAFNLEGKDFSSFSSGSGHFSLFSTFDNR